MVRSLIEFAIASFGVVFLCRFVEVKFSNGVSHFQPIWQAMAAGNFFAQLLYLSTQCFYFLSMISIFGVQSVDCDC